MACMDVSGGGSTAGSGAGSVSSSGMLGSDMGMHVAAPKKKRKNHKLPTTKKDAKLSMKHHRESVAFNLSHAKDHLDEAKQHVIGLKKVTKLEKQLSSLRKGKVKF